MTVRCPEQPEAKVLQKRLPDTMTVQKLKSLLQRVYKVDSSSQRLSYLDLEVSAYNYTCLIKHMQL